MSAEELGCWDLPLTSRSRLDNPALQQLHVKSMSFSLLPKGKWMFLLIQNCRKSVAMCDIWIHMGSGCLKV